MLGINSEKVSLAAAADPDDKAKPSFSKVMLDRIKKHSILNHTVFRQDGVNRKLQVKKNWERYQQLVSKTKASKTQL